jgi:hypothetical protein
MSPADWTRPTTSDDHLNRNVASEFGIARAIHLAHSTRAQERANLVGSETCTRRHAHELARLYGRAGDLTLIVSQTGALGARRLNRFGHLTSRRSTPHRLLAARP